MTQDILEAALARFHANGGQITRVPVGTRTIPRREMRERVRGEYVAPPSAEQMAERIMEAGREARYHQLHGAH